MLHPTIFNTSQVCHQLGVRYSVLSPGSRNAPLLISFARHEKVEKVIVPDERAAGFIALGIAQYTKTPVVLSCTSGTALLNYAPAVAEAYYREIPLILLSADRPPELIDQRDGQTIRQYEALKNHVKRTTQLPVLKNTSDSSSYLDNLIETIKLSDESPKGPVHLNIPFTEPFYPKSDQKDLIFSEVTITEHTTHSETNSINGIPDGKKIMVLIGQSDTDPALNRALATLSPYIPVIRSPLNNLDSGISHVDAFIKDQASLKPDILLTAGLSVLSKNLKTFLRKYMPELHYHFDPSGVEVDTYGSGPKILKQPIESILSLLAGDMADSDYLAEWKTRESKAKFAISSFIKRARFSETTASHFIFNSIPKDSILHLSNSMPVRYADLFGVPAHVETYCNRGTSGIDGCTSTALGTALVSQKLNLLVTGDLAFLYDRNAFFHNYDVPNLRVVVINNQGGGIFRLINGPSSQPELETYFETRHNKTAEYICAENNLDYLTASDSAELEEAWLSFLGPSKEAKVLEVFTDPKINESEYKKLRNYINEQC